MQSGVTAPVNSNILVCKEISFSIHCSYQYDMLPLLTYISSNNFLISCVLVLLYALFCYIIMT